MEDFNSLTKSVYEGVTDEIEGSIISFKKEQEKSFVKAAELL